MIKRRNFLGWTGATAATGLAANLVGCASTGGKGLMGAGAKDAGPAGAAAAPAKAPAMGGQAKISIGVIGAGSRGQELIRQLQHTGQVQVAACCDIYAPRTAETRKITGAETPFVTDYNDLLARKDLDAVVVATPLYLHAKHVSAALKSGRPVFGEKSMGFTLGHCNDIVAARESTGNPFQVGHQYRLAPWFAEAAKHARSGAIGTVTHVHAYWHRNHNWRRDVPLGPDGKRDPKLERLINWRHYREYSGGLMTELASHHIDFANWVFNDTPATVSATGGIDFYKDGREVYDNILATFQYKDGGSFSFSSITSNAQMGMQIWVYGSKGSIHLTRAGVNFYDELKGAKPMDTPKLQSATAYKTSDKEETKNAVDGYSGASYRVGTERPGTGIWRKNITPEPGLTANATYLGCAQFVDVVKTGKENAADVYCGWGSATAAALANQSIESGRRLTVKDHVKIPAGLTKKLAKSA